VLRHGQLGGNVTDKPIQAAAVAGLEPIEQRE
jgi:hypothetical protein